MNLKQGSITSFFKRDKRVGDDSSSDEEDLSVYEPSKKKSLFDRPMHWTRVRAVEGASTKRVTVFNVEDDLQADKALQQVRKGAVRELGQMLFDPDEFKGTEDQLTMADHRLSSDQLLEYAKMATAIRRDLISRAEALTATGNQDQEEEEGDGLQQMIQKREHKYSSDKQEKMAMTAAFRGSARNPSHPRRKRRTRWQMSADERFEVVKMAASKAMTAEEVASHFNVNVRAVYSLVSAAKTKKFDCFVKKKKSEVRRAQDREAVVDAIQ